MKWITDELKAEIRKVFESRYEHPLTDTEINFIAENLTQLFELFFQMKSRVKNENE